MTESYSGYRIALATTVAEIEPYAAEWDRLVEQAPARIHSIAHAWITSFYEHFVGPTGLCRCILAFDNGALVGAMPLVLSMKHFSFLKKTEVRPPANYQTFAADLVCRSEDADAIIDAMIDTLDRHLPRAWELSFHHVSERSQVVTRFPTASRRVLYCSEIDGYGNFVRIEGSFDGYMSALSPEFARNLKRVSRKLEQLPDYRVDFWNGDTDSGDRVARFLELEGSGWKGKEGTAIICHPNESAFYRDFTRRLDRRGWLRWNELHANGALIASQMAVKIGRVLYLWKIAYDERYRPYAPGNALMLQTIRRAFETGDTDEVNCLTNSAWNRDWNMERRTYYNVTVWPRRLLPFLAGYCRARAKDYLRKAPYAKACYRAVRGALLHVGQRRPFSAE